mmetsp:Transcript_27579/g.50913  ORF Transcript_27579/g.50913 Transcript_27579/m.50913 type:complete len:642 (-) Transcript_27579:196-2121(-)
MMASEIVSEHCHDVIDKALKQPSLELCQSPTCSISKSSSIRIVVKDLSYIVVNEQPTVDKSDKNLYLLRNVNAFFLPGETSALMGPSGSGKTTLLDLLAGRKTVGRREGAILFEGIEPSHQFLRKFAGYVEQFDTLIGVLTVEEMLLYTADLKCPLSVSHEAKRAIVENLIAQLALDRCRHVRIGDSMRKGISGGQAKRTNIAIALVTTPKVLFLDEPTTGLDSYTSNEVMTVVQRLSRTGVTVCATIHSPTSFCFSLFDRVLMLISGRVVYFGPRGETAKTHFLNQLSPQRREAVEQTASKSKNLAEVLVNIITEADRSGHRDDLVEGYLHSPLAAENISTRDQILNESLRTVKEDPRLMKELGTTTATVTPWWWGVRTYIMYRTRKNFRDINFLLPRSIDKISNAILISTLYANVGRSKHGSERIQSLTSILYMMASTSGFAASGYMPVLVLERPLFVRERHDGVYHVNTYFMSKFIEEFTLNIFLTLALCLIVYFSVGFSGNFGVFWFAYFMGEVTGIIMAYSVAALSPNMDIANAILPIYALMLMLLGGFLLRYPDIPPWWRWFSYVNFCRYSWSAVMKNQFGGDQDVTFLQNMTVLQYYELENVNTWGWIGITIGFLTFFYFLAIFILTFSKYQSR